MSPLHLTDHPATQKMMKVFRPDFEIPSRRTLARDIDAAFKSAQVDLTNILHGLKTVATTADSWSSHHRSFLGMTVHWIDEDDLRRKHGTLACQELKVSIIFAFFL